MPVSPECWRRLSILLDAMLDLPPDQRGAWLARQPLVPGERAELERLLAAADAAPAWLTRPQQIAARVNDSTLGEGTPIGSFVITGELGRGGMGVVYAARRDQSDYQQSVALKLLHGGFNSVERSARFVLERRLLARLEHPGIARFIDGGITAAGQPWYAMERVDGVQIDHHCDQRHAGLRQRLHLFLEVCAAVQYAHGQLVVHCDIKPSNILVDADGRVRLLDFGIARALDDADSTVNQWRAMTPAYAAPEQLRGEPASVASDIWSLGVLLYRLLSNRLPFATEDGSAADPASILQTGPPAPSQALTNAGPITARSLRGDLDAIVARAMEQEPGRRYVSVDALAEDLRQHLDAQPVKARHGNWAYRSGCFLRRYRLPVAITLVAVLALAVTLLYALSAARRAQLEADRTSLVKEFLIGLFEIGDPDRSGQGQVNAGTLLRLGADRALSEFSGDPVLRIDLARSIAKLAGTLGDYEQGIRALDAALAVDARLDDSVRAELLLDRSELQRNSARPQAALADLDAVAALMASGPDRPALRARASRLRARMHQDASEFVEARAGIEYALALDQQHGGEGGDAVARDLEALAELEHAAGNRTEAQRLWSELLASERHRLGESHTRIADLENSLGIVAAEAGDKETAESHFRRAAELHEALLGSGHPLLARTLRNWGGSRRLTGDAESAEALYQRALTIYLDVLGPEHPETGHAHNSLGVLHAGRGDLVRAREQLLLARHAFASSQPDSPVLATIELNLAAIDVRFGEWDPARRGFDSALQHLLALYGEHNAQVAAALSGQARLAVADGQPAIALAILQRAEAVHEHIYPGEHLDRQVVALGKARVLMLLDRHPEATTILGELATRLGTNLAPADPVRQELAMLQATLLLHEGQAEEAAKRIEPVLAVRRAAIASAPVAFVETALTLA
ncbi:MAG: serine/threonine-protein kinase, partial [Dokdonella sp.]|uniref:serine/threonine-protein kinase n=2 Tax=Dokdonella sp. TaxID=2291710 RepID=UPI003BAEC820